MTIRDCPFCNGLGEYIFWGEYCRCSYCDGKGYLLDEYGDEDKEVEDEEDN